MSREIKFRVWQSEERRMLFNCGVQRPTGGYLWGFGVPASAGVDDIEHYGRHDSVMQFTGLCDKNGVEIYEGDILRDPVDGDAMTVFYAQAAAMFCFAQKGDDIDTPELPLSDVMLMPTNEKREPYVIRNVHENLDLLG